jgi:2-polyprenyl-3-methyl-5-hydroxy-6-metoxy-1,4-benzoquinol methylase
MTTSGTHLYQRDVLSEHATSLSKLSARMTRGSQVLELGPAAGYFTRILKSALQCQVDAIEIDEKMAAQARPHCRDLLVADLDSLDWAKVWPQRRYDTIIAADVLEHLRSPERALEALRTRLNHGGKLLISLPNIAYSGMILGLLEDGFRYRAEGLLDRTHLKFFTRTTLEEMLTQCGWRVTWRGEVRKDIFESEFHSRIEKWPASLREYVLEHPARAAYQLLCECVPGPKVSVEPEVSDSVTSGHGEFGMRLMWADSAEQISFERAQVRFARVGAREQSVEWSLETDAHVLRLRLSDRPGFLRIHRIELETPAKVPTAQIELSTCALSTDLHRLAQNTYLLDTAESWLQLPPARYAAGTRLRVVCDWPMSPEYRLASTELGTWTEKLRALEARLLSAQADLQAQLRSTEALVAQRDEQLAVANNHVLHLEEIAEQRGQVVAQRDEQLAAANKYREEIESLLQAARAELTLVSHEREVARAQTQAHAQRIAELRSFRNWWRHRFSKS